MASATRFADRGVVVRGDGRDLRLLESAADRSGQRPERCHHRADAAVEPALQVDGAGAGGDVADAIGEDRLGEDRRGARAVPHGVAGALGGLAHHLRAEILDGILEVHLLGDGDAVIADERRAVLLLDEHGLGLGTQRDPHRIGQRVHALEHLFPRVGPEQHLLVRHDVTSLYEIDAGRHCSMTRRPVETISATAVPRSIHRDFTGLWANASPSSRHRRPTLRRSCPIRFAVTPGGASSSVGSRSIHSGTSVALIGACQDRDVNACRQ